MAECPWRSVGHHKVDPILRLVAQHLVDCRVTDGLSFLAMTDNGLVPAGTVSITSRPYGRDLRAILPYCRGWRRRDSWCKRSGRLLVF